MTPNGWSASSLGALGKWIGGGTPSKGTPSFWDGDVPWVSPKDMHSSVLLDTEDHISEEAIATSATSAVPAETVLIVTRSGILRHTLPVAVTSRRMAINQDLKALLPGGHVLGVFVAQLVRCLGPDILRQCAKVGTTVESIDFGALKEFPVLLPPLPEQRKIAAILSSVDAAIEGTQAVIDQLQVVKKAMMAELLTRGIPGRHTKFKMTEIGEVPEGWEVRRIAELGEVKLGRMRSPVYVQGTNRPYLRVANVLDGRIDTSDVLTMPFEDHQYPHFRLKSGDILLNEGQSLELVGRSAVYRGDPPDCAFQKTLLRFRASKLICVEFAQFVFQWFLYSGRFAEHAVQTTSIAHLTGVRFEAMRMPLPPFDEQAEIAHAITSIGQRLVAEESDLAALGAAKSALMSVLLTGEVRVQPDGDDA